MSGNAIRCSRCRQSKAPDQFAPSHRTNGDWCRSCRRDYMRSYYTPVEPLHGPLRPGASKICVSCGYHTADRTKTCHACRVDRSTSARLRWARRHEAWQIEGLAAFMSGTAVQRYADDPNKRRRLALRRARQIDGDRPTVTRLAERDDWSCHLCGSRIDPNLVGTTDKMRPSIDHLVPISDGGLDTMTNTKLAHLRCNARRGTGGTVQLLLVG